ncbi:ParB/RepB/Spo0J family partition protein [Emergencia sp. 1XD21-10]|uniref:ParB/RepB/Spo0J family partition protein n=1 Tax=Emergencia sp. 1XD21-10 TaxID=2304569 RepID=UPI00137B8B88|nr:ParB/RepB/Spo0J family partition protein [Emergencia sp. 1XD21-10]NCE98191.1 ParB/RepB/Spo0J family partition protein [Emergencia sp. 1XD21-10]
MQECVVQEIPIQEIRLFGGDYGVAYFHLNKRKVAELVESIAEVGVLEPLIVRKDPTGAAAYELIAGRTRLTAAKQVGLETVPCMVCNLNDSKATCLYGESNRYREDITITEKAFMLRYFDEFVEDIEKVQNGGIRRNALFDDMNQMDEREKRRRIRLTYLVPRLRELVDCHKISISVGSEASYLPEEIQNRIYFELIGSRKILSQQAVREIRTAYQEKRPFGQTLTATEINQIIERNQNQNEKVKIGISKEIIDRLPPEYQAPKEKEKLLENLIKKFLKNT